MNEHFIYEKNIECIFIIRIPKPNVCDGVYYMVVCVNVFANARVIATKKSCVQFSIQKSMFGIKLCIHGYETYSWL